MSHSARVCLGTLLLALLVGGTALQGCADPSRTGSTTPIVTSPMLAEYGYYATAEELVHKADAVVVGTVLASVTRETSIGEVVDERHLVSSVRVQRVIKGDLAPGDTIEVRQLLSADSPARIWLNREGMRAILFLSAWPDRSYEPVNPWQGVVAIVDGKTKAAPGNDAFETPAGEEDVVTELAGLAE